MCMICISLSVISASTWADCKISLILSFFNSYCVGVFLGVGT